LLRSQSELSDVNDPEFSIWRKVYERAMRVGPDAIPQMRVNVTGFYKGSRGLEVDANATLQQLNLSLVLKGSSSLVSYLSELITTAKEDAHHRERCVKAAGAEEPAQNEPSGQLAPCRISLNFEAIAVTVCAASFAAGF
jgi:hypothetical protein